MNKTSYVDLTLPIVQGAKRISNINSNLNKKNAAKEN